MRLDGLRALVVGGSGGMGAASSRALAAEGAAVAVHYGRSKDAADAVVRSIVDAGGTAVAVQGDIRSKSVAAKLVGDARGALGGLDALLVFAGHPFRDEEWYASYESLSEEAWRAPLDVDLLGSVFVTQAVVPHFREQRAGRIVLVGSTAPITGDVEGFTYLVAKAGILALTRALAQDLGPYGVHVNALAPGWIATAPTKTLSPGKSEAAKAEAALNRFGTPEEVAAKAVFLCSAESDFMTGQTVIVDGGYAMR